ncbi:hypothetical protein FB45DRAFT_1046615 [Roridomyces roridus]|uniref:Myb/SANT-like domain-containing protein n=1 Tax=Roridomyces roridus TaxID=1738132 RepID=A0AAD7F7X0_9AGAR|nr:hypothetical protein FB45DRAFT_1046615 [Roridomyces roridus]
MAAHPRLPLAPEIIEATLAAQQPPEHSTPTLKSKKPAASWTTSDTDRLVAFLVKKHSRGGDGANFTKTVWNEAASDVNLVLTKGGPKNGDSCKSKYQKLKATYFVVLAIINNSGWAWDDRRGACIGPGQEGTWAAWVAANPKAAPFRNAGWSHLNNFRKLLPTSTPRGRNVFRAALPDEAPPNDDTPQPTQLEDEDEDQDYDGWAGSMDWDPARLERLLPIVDTQEGKDDEEEEDGESDKENNATPVLQTPAPSRKRRAATPSTGTATKKGRTSTGAAALHDIVGQMGDFNDILRASLAAPIFEMLFNQLSYSADSVKGTPRKTFNTPPGSLPSTPARLQAAIKRAQKLETWLDKPQLVSLFEILEGNKSAVDVYASLDDEELRVMWVRRKVGLD